MEEKPKNKGGRPSKYKPEYCQQLVNLMSNGYPFEASLADFSVTKKTGYTWCEKYPEFLHAKKEGEIKCQRWLIEQGMKGLKGEIEKFNATIWIFMMKNICHWRDKRDIDIKADKGVINVNFTKDK